ncbi:MULTISPECIES: hypothetical protein [unclassified Glutamicibacter]|uniref:hypothetical protein n=1 Tax=unclassified Glutamicibacter TaxID=2627139 RepID=UPI003828DD01
MDTSEFTDRLIVAIDDAHTLINGGSIDTDELIFEGQELARASSQGTGTCVEVHRLAALMIIGIAKANFSVERSTEWHTCLKLCQRSRNDLRRLQPYDCDAIRMLWAIGHKADELASRGVRARSPQKLARHTVRPLQNRPFEEALAGYGDRPGEPEHVPERTMETKTARILTGPDAEGQYFSAGEYWPNTGAK